MADKALLYCCSNLDEFTNEVCKDQTSFFQLVSEYNHSLGRQPPSFFIGSIG